MNGHRAWYQFTAVLMLLIVSSLSCSMSTTPEQDSDMQGSVRNNSLVVLLAPINNSTYAEGVQVDFHAIAQDTESGVARIEFRVDDAPVGEVVSKQAGGESTLDAVISWVATGTTGHLVTAEAFRSDGSSLGLSDAAIKVVEKPLAQLPLGNAQTAMPPSAAQSTSPGATDTDESTAIPSLTPGSMPPASPSPSSSTSSGQPAAVVNVATVNVRQGPSTAYAVVGVLRQGDRVNIVGRNADSTWWAVSYSSGTAWVYAALTTTQGNVSGVPLVAAPPPPATATPTAQPTVAGNADLVIDSVRLDPATPQANITFTVYAVVRNAGTVPSPEADAMLTFQPGDERSPADPHIPALQPGQSKEIFFRVTLKGSGTNLSGSVEVDVYNTVNEGTAGGEANNVKTVIYNVNP